MQNGKTKKPQIIILDGTLRDGEQQIGVNFNCSDKILITKKLLEAGVEQITVMPIVSKDEEETSKKLLKLNPADKIYSDTMLGTKFVDHSYDLGFKNIVLFSSLSDRLLKIKKITKRQNLEKAIAVCKYAKERGMGVVFAGEDATRADINYVIKFIKSIQENISSFILCDTVGILTPRKTKTFMSHIKNNVKCKLGAHFHNDRGLANKNTIIAVKNGVEVISGTAGGIGERAGNADWCDVLIELKNEGVEFGNIDYSKLRKLKALVYKRGGARPAKPYSSRAFWHESGIHVRALLEDKLSYNSFPPEKFGKRNKFFYGKFSGTASYKDLFGEKYTDTQLIKIRDKMKELSYKNKKSYSPGETKDLVSRMSA